jgi:predicted esterase
MKHLLLIAFLFAMIACDDDDQGNTTGGTPAGAQAGTPAGSEGGTPAGSEGGTPAGSEGGTPAGSEGGTPAGSEGGTPAGAEAGTQAGTQAGAMGGEMMTNETSKLWFLKVKLVDVGGIISPFQVELKQNPDVPNVYTHFIIRAVKDGAVSEDLADITDVMIAQDGTFTVNLDMVLPAAYSPTLSDVQLSLVLAAQPFDAGFCGGITGELVTLGSMLTRSTFAAVPWEEMTEMSPSSCEDQGPKSFPRVETCPALTTGENTFESAGLMRKVKIFTPAGTTAESADLPLIFLWHGLGGTADDIEMDAQLSTFVEDQKFILAVPSSDAAVEGVEWASLSYEDSQDLAFFDDMVKCIGEGFPVDQNRIHTTGLSAGGLWTAYLSMTRSEVLASAVGMSSGLLPGYPSMAPARKIPYLVAWGGVNDIAYDQNFDQLAQSLITTLLGNSHFVLTCNHGQEHKWLPEFSPWVLKFLLDHPKDLAQEPYTSTETLPDVYPDYCMIPN